MDKHTLQLASCYLINWHIENGSINNKDKVMPLEEIENIFADSLGIYTQEMDKIYKRELSMWILERNNNNTPAARLKLVIKLMPQRFWHGSIYDDAQCILAEIQQHEL